MKAKIFPMIAIAVLILVLSAMPAYSQFSINQDTKCPDYCSDGVLYIGGQMIGKECHYKQEIKCKYGCEKPSKTLKTINQKPKCAEYPDKPPVENQTEMNEILFMLLKKLYETGKNSYKIQIHGTEYKPGERGKVFLQLLDSDNLPIENATCYCSIYYPDGFDKWKEDQFMTYTGEGLYFYPFTTPYTEGVYMVSAYCIIPEPNWTVYQAYDDFETASESGGTGDWQDDWYLEGNTDFSTNNPYQGSYSLRLRGGNGYADRSVTSSDEVDRVVVSFWARAYSLESADFGYFTFCGNDDATNCTTVQTWTDGDDDNVWHYYSFTFNKEDYNWSERIWLEFDVTGFSGSGDHLYIDNVNVTLINNVKNTTEYQFVRGSGEVHVSGDMEYSYYFSDGYMNITEGNEFGGIAYLNLTVRSLVAETRSVDVSISGFNYYYCTDILDFRFWNGTAWVSVTNYTCYYDSSVGKSVLTFTQEFNRSDVYNYYFKLRNKWYRTFDFIYSGMNKTYDVVYDICEWYFTQDNKTLPSFPLNETTEDCVNADSVECWCEHILETIYQARVKREFVDSLNTSYDNPDSLDAMYQYLEALVELDKDLRPNYDTYVNQLFNYMLVSDSFKGNFTKYFWDITSAKQTLDSLNSLPEETWNYADRTLTDYNQTEIISLLQEINATTGIIRVTVFHIGNTTDEINQTTHNTYDLLYNLTIGNVTVSAYVNWTQGVVEMHDYNKPEVQHADILSFAASQSNPVQEISHAYCLNNDTLAYDINTTKCVLDKCYTITQTIPKVCDYGCYQGRCNPAPFERVTFVMEIMFIMFIVIVILVFVYQKFA